MDINNLHNKIFETEADYTSAKSSLNKPSVSYVEETRDVKFDQWERPRLRFVAEQANSTIKLSISVGSPTPVNLEYSTDGMNWTDYNIRTDITLNNVGDKVYFRNKSEVTTGFSTSSSNYYQFGMTGKIAAFGDVTFLLNKNGDVNELSDYCFFRLFNGCTGLTTAPELPATTLAEDCYGSMFYGCTGLTTAPELPATTLAESCYSGMFWNCTSLTTAPALPATTIAPYCYYYMFYGCTGLTTAPELPATTLAESCYQCMFIGCTSLNYIKCLAINHSASNCTGEWLKNVSSTGTFVKATGASWSTGKSGIPSGWTVEEV